MRVKRRAEAREKHKKKEHVSEVEEQCVGGRAIGRMTLRHRTRKRDRERVRV